jgi:hypothetical protein
MPTDANCNHINNLSRKNTLIRKGKDNAAGFGATNGLFGATNCGKLPVKCGFSLTFSRP